MSISKFYESNSSRTLEIIVGMVLTLISLIFWVGIITIIIQAPIEVSIYIAVSFLTLIAFLLSRLSFRLLTNRGRADGSLLSPFAISFGAIVLLTGGIGLMILGFTEWEWRSIAGGLGGAVTGIYAINLARKRRKKNGI